MLTIQNLRSMKSHRYMTIQSVTVSSHNIFISSSSLLSPYTPGALSVDHWTVLPSAPSVPRSCKTAHLGPVRLKRHLYGHNLGNTTLDTGFTKTRYNIWRIPLNRRPPDREELRNPMVASKSFFNQVDCHSPPRKQSRQHPEITSRFNASCYTAAFTIT